MTDEMIALADCQKGHLYRLRSRNLAVGVFDGDTGFVGIREKFGDRFLFTEYHWEAPSFATVRPLEDMGLCPVGDLSCYWADRCGACGQPVNFDKARPLDERWQHDAPGDCDEVQPVAARNRELFDWLEPFDAAETQRQNAERRGIR